MGIIFLFLSVAFLIASVILLIIRVNRLEDQVKELSDIAAHTASILDKVIDKTILSKRNLSETIQRLSRLYEDKSSIGYTQFLKGRDGELIPVPPPPTETPDKTAEPKN